MKLIATVTLILLLGLPAIAGQDMNHKTASGWYDMENCAFCQHLIEDPGLLEHTTWETHKIKNGSVTVLTVAPEYRQSYEKAGAAIEALGQKMMTGEVNPMGVEMCGRCMMYGQIMMSGAEIEEVRGDHADVSLMTSGNPDVVKMIHQMVDRDAEEMAELMGQAHEHHHGHSH